MEKHALTSRWVKSLPRTRFGFEDSSYLHVDMAEGKPRIVNERQVCIYVYHHCYT